ncbi:MAG: cbb3-type cytochrome c oxidase subunit I [Janthinobacterium lividum]
MNFVDKLGNLSINKSSINWIKNGILALGIAGAYSIVIVCLRTPFLNKIITNNQIFKSALIIHVNLSVLVWLISIIASIWGYKSSYAFDKIYFRLSFVSTLIIGISPFFGQNSIINNYIPMLDNAIFILGLSLFGISVLLFAINSLINSLLLQSSRDNQFIEIGSVTSAIMFVGVWACFILSYRGLIKSSFLINIELYYELIYWSGGHLLQFLYTQMLMIVWVILTSLVSKKELGAKKIYYTILILNFILSLLILGGHFNEISSAEFKQYFTNHMRYMGGIAPTLCIIALICDTRVQYKSAHPFIKSSIICSCLLFLSGGLIGLLISGTNVTIPAHYHGSIVGISVAFMGFAYACIFLRKESKKWGINYASIQLYIITIGQIMHISGLAIAGGYGVLRKTTNIEMSLNIKLALGLMGGGGLIAIAGGLMFVIICGRNLSLFGSKKNLSNIS